MPLRAQVCVELRVAAVERECRLYRIGQLAPRDLRRPQVDLRRLEVPARPGQLCPVVQAQVLAPRDHGHGIEEPGEILDRLADFQRGRRTSRLFSSSPAYPGTTFSRSTTAMKLHTW